MPFKQAVFKMSDKKVEKLNIKTKYISDFPPNGIKLSLLKNITKNEEFIECTVTEQAITTSGAHFLGILTKINIKGKTINGDKEINLFVKQIQRDSILAFIPIVDIYNTEAFVYNELLPIYEELQHRFHIPTDIRFRAAKSYVGNNTEVIILENLATKGFTTLHRMEVLPLRFVQLSVEQLAKFHALSMVLQKLNPEYFDKKLKVIQTQLQGEIFLENSTKYSRTAIGILTDEYRKKLEKVLDAFGTKLNRHFNLSKKGVCICHGDYRACNILYKETDGEIQQVIPIDFQLLHYGSPINDFMCLLFLGTDGDFRRQHMENLKNMYYSSLQQFLVYFDIDVDDIFSKKEFQLQFSFALEYGLLVAMIVLPYLFISDNSMADSEFELDNRYKIRMEGIVDDFIEMGYF